MCRVCDWIATEIDLQILKSLDFHTHTNTGSFIKFCAESHYNWSVNISSLSLHSEETTKATLLTLNHVAVGTGLPLKGTLILNGSPAGTVIFCPKPSRTIFGAPVRIDKWHVFL